MTDSGKAQEIPWVDISRFHIHAELTEILQRLARDYPTLAALESIGKSHEDRDIWLMTLTNQATGPADEKPAMYIDGNIHAGEVTGCNVALHTIDMLLHGYGSDAEITELLDTRTFYIHRPACPAGWRGTVPDNAADAALIGAPVALV